MNIRQARKEDVSAIIEVMQDAEHSGFMLFEPGERQINGSAFQSFIENIHTKPTSALFVAAKERNILGYIIIQNERLMRTSYRASIVIGVHSKSRGKGVDQALFTHAIEWAKEKQLHRLELTVIENNTRAIQLYKRMGFEVEGIKRDSLYINGAFVNELYMSLLL